MNIRQVRRKSIRSNCAEVSGKLALATERGSQKKNRSQRTQRQIVPLPLVSLSAFVKRFNLIFRLAQAAPGIFFPITFDGGNHLAPVAGHFFQLR